MSLLVEPAIQRAFGLVADDLPLLREWVDDDTPPGRLDALAAHDEAAWREGREPYLLYR